MNVDGKGNITKYEINDKRDLNKKNREEKRNEKLKHAANCCSQRIEFLPPTNAQKQYLSQNLQVMNSKPIDFVNNMNKGYPIQKYFFIFRKYFLSSLTNKRFLQEQFQSLGAELIVTKKMVQNVKRTKKRKKKEVFSDAGEVLDYCKHYLLALVLYPQSNLPPLCLIADVRNIARTHHGTLHTDHTFYSNEHTIFCMSQQESYCFVDNVSQTIKEGKRGFGFGYALAKRKDASMISLILRRIKSQIKSETGLDWRPSRFVIDFDQGFYF